MTYEQAMKATSRELKIRGFVRLADTTQINLTSEHIMAYSIDEGSNEIPLGAAASASYSLELANADGEWFRGGSMIGNRVLMGALVKIEIGVYHDGGFEYKDAGRWYVNKATGKEGTTRFTLRGGDKLLTRLNAAFSDNITYSSSTTVTTILNRVKALAGTINGTLACNANAVISTKPDWGAGCSIRNVLAFVAAAGGCFVQTDRDGVLQLVPVKKPGTAKAIATDSYLELENGNEYFSFNRIKVMPRGAKSEDPYIEGTVNSGTAEAGNNTIVMSDNPLFAAGASNLQTMVNALATALSGYAVDVLSFRHRGDPTFVLGDRVQVTDRRGAVVNTPILQQSLKYGNGFSSMISCMLSLETMLPSAISRNGTILSIGFGKGSLDPNVLIARSITTEYLAAGSITADEIAADAITSDKIAADSIDTEHLKAGAITADKAIIADAAIKTAQIQDAAITGAKIGDAEITRAKIKDGEITNAHIDTAGIDYARIRDLVAGTAIITDGIGGKLIIDRLAVSEANIVNLTAGQLLVEGTSGALYRLTVDGTGQVITELRQIGNSDIADTSLDAGQKLVKSSITADLLDVQQIFASEALIGAIKAVNIETHSIGVDQLTPGLIEGVVNNATGQQLVVEFTYGTILDRERTETIARIRVFHLGAEITHRMPDNAIHWERISDDRAGDLVWNALPAHQGSKSITINGADIDFKGVLRCRVDEARLYSVPSINDDGELIMTDYGEGDSLLFALSGLDLVYTGETAYENRFGELWTDMLIGAFFLDTQMSNLKTAYLDISRHGIEMYADGYLSLISGSKFNMRAGSGSKSIGLSNDHVGEYFAWAGAANPASAPFYVTMDGTVRATKLQLNNSNITDFTQMYPYSDADNASPDFPMTFRVFVPSECSGVESVKLTFTCEPFRAYSTSAASGGGATSSSGGGSSPTSRSGGAYTLTASNKTGLYTGSSEAGTKTPNGTVFTGHTHDNYPHIHNVPDHNHLLSVPAHTHVTDIPQHTHGLPDHSHGIVYGIYEGTKASAVQVRVDGTYVGNYSALTARDVTSYLTKSSGIIIRNAWHTITLTPNRLTRIVAQAFVVAVVGRANNAIY